MVPPPRASLLNAGLGAVVLLLAGAGVGLLRHDAGLDAYPNMPDEQQAFWRWVAWGDQDPGAALETGVDLLTRHPGVEALYPRLATLCMRAEQEVDCRQVFNAVRPPDALSEQYRQAALALLLPPDEAQAAWETLAASRDLDLVLARLITDEAIEAYQREGSPRQLVALQKVWDARLEADTAAAAALFGKAYFAGRTGRFQEAEQHLTRLTRLRPDDPEVYREWGRVYDAVGTQEEYRAALEKGIALAEVRFDIDQATILRGNLGRSLLAQGDLEGADRMFTAALNESRRWVNRETEAFNLQRLANVRLRQHAYAEAFALMDEAHVLFDSLGNQAQLVEVAVLRGTALSDGYRFGQAIRVLRRAKRDAEAQGLPQLIAHASVPLAQVLYRMGRYEEAVQAATDALDQAQAPAETHAAALLILGDIARRQGELQQARDRYTQALTIAETSGNRAQAAVMQQRMGWVALNVRNFPAAQQHFDAAKRQLAEGSDASSLARFDLDVGRLYARYANHALAIEQYQDAADRLRALGDDRFLTTALVEEAWAHIEEDKLAKARAVLAEADSLTRRTVRATELYRVAIAHANLELHATNYTEALFHFKRAQRLEARLPYMPLRWHVLHGIGIAEWKLGRYEEAEAHLREAMALVEDLRQGLTLIEERAAFVDNKVSVYKTLASLLEERGRDVEAAEVTERARSRSLAELINTNKQSRTLDPAVPAEQAVEALQQQRAILEDLQAQQYEADAEQVAGEATQERATEVRLRRAARLVDAFAERDSLVQAHLASLRGVAPLEMASIQATLKPDEALIMYALRDAFTSEHFGMDGGAVYVVTPDSVWARSLDVRVADLAEAVRFFREQISEVGAPVVWESSSVNLYERLVAPALEGLPESVSHLHIIPEGVLNYLPFAALQDREGTYLVEQYTLSTAPSASVLKACRDRNPNLWRSILLVADPHDRLPGSRREVEAIASLGRYRPTTLIGEHATQEKVETLIGMHDIVHIATHGTFARRTPWLSYLELYESALYAAEVDALPLHTSYLVTLSACETGLSSGLHGDIPAGDEWVGLNQAFLAAGAPTVMTSLWPIDDRVSSEFMTAFYSNLLTARGKAVALAHVQRGFLQNPETQHPFYWAPFVVVGDPL